MSSPASDQKLSKNEAKRRAKAEKKAKEAEAKAQQAAVSDKAPKMTKDEEKDSGESEDPSEYFNFRCNAVADMKATGDDPYPHKFHVSISLTDFIEKYSHLKDCKYLTPYFPFLNCKSNIFYSSSSGGCSCECRWPSALKTRVWRKAYFL